MGQKEVWIPPGAPLSEGYWQSLLRDGEYGRAASSAEALDLWEERASDVDEQAQAKAESTAVEDPWERASELMSQGEVLEVPVVGSNRGGLVVGWNGLRGFVPASHLVELTSSMETEKGRDELRRLVGTRLSLKIIELDQERNRFVLSQRAAQVDAAQERNVLDELEPGDVCQGRVTNLCSFGAFVDLGGFEGLVHISELSWGRVAHPGDILDPGQSVDVYVLNVDPKRERVGLSVKRLRPNPWQSVDERYRVGQIVEGTVTHVVDFGAFVQVEDGLEGLIHVSELTAGTENGPRGNSCNPHDILQADDVVSVEVLTIEGARRRMGLRLQRVQSGGGTSASRRTEGEEPRAGG